MNGDSYKIIISLSHHRIAYEYWQRDGENKLVPMPNGTWPAPLAFYCSDNGIIIGEDAARASNTGTSNAFENYFEQLIEDKRYIIGGQNRPIRNILLDASESIFREFFRNVLYDRFGALSDNRASMPLTIVCESDVKPPERALLNGLFKDSGYSRVKVVDYDKYIEKYIKETLSKEYVCDKVLVAWIEGTNLTFTLFDVNGSSALKQKSFEGLGVDPRKEYVKKLIWNSVIGQNPWLMESNEEDAINKAASDFLNSSMPMINDTILLSDGQKYHYSLNRNNIDYIQSNDGVSIKNILEVFLRDNGINNRSRVLLLLRGVAGGNSYFEQNLSQGFSKTIKSDRKLRDNIMKLLISEDKPQMPNIQIGVGPNPLPPDVSGEKKKKWRQVKAEANGKIRSGQSEVALQILKDFKSECASYSGVDDLLSEINAEIEKIVIVEKLPIVDGTAVHNLERRWREVKATAKAKSRFGHITEAISILKSFANEVSKVSGTDELLSSINNELSLVQQLKLKHLDGDIHSNGKEEKESKSEVQEYLQQGKFKEARDWYRSQNNNNMAKILTEIIRSQKGIEMRKSSIEEYRKTKNKDQISRIIKEIQDYIELCEKSGVNTAEYRRLLAEYRKI